MSTRPKRSLRLVVDGDTKDKAVNGFIRDGFDWSGRTGRGRFTCIVFVHFAVIAAFALLKKGSPGSWGNAAICASYAAVFVLFIGYTIRRLHDIGRNGAYALLGVIPILGPVFLIFLMLKPTTERQYRPAPKWVSRLGYGTTIIVSIFVLSRAIWEPYWIPSGSMKPTLLIGDYLLVTKPRAKTMRGDVVAFRHPVNGSAYIARIVGLPGDQVSAQNGILSLNGTELRQEAIGQFHEIFAAQGPYELYPRCQTQTRVGDNCEKQLLTETLPSGRSYHILNIHDTSTDTMPTLSVPDDHLLILGDNRDNSLDSRIPQTAGGVGFVPIDHLIGRARVIVFSSDGHTLANPLSWRPGRFFVPIR